MLNIEFKGYEGIRKYWVWFNEEGLVMLDWIEKQISLLLSNETFAFIDNSLK